MHLSKTDVNFIYDKTSIDELRTHHIEAAKRALTWVETGQFSLANIREVHIHLKLGGVDESAIDPTKNLVENRNRIHDAPKKGHLAQAQYWFARLKDEPHYYKDVRNHLDAANLSTGDLDPTKDPVELVKELKSAQEAAARSLIGPTGGHGRGGNSRPVTRFPHEGAWARFKGRSSGDQQ